MNTNSKTKTMALTAMMTAVLAILSPISIPTTPVPITLGLFAVFLTSATLTPLLASSSVCIYILLGMVGLPVFSNYMGGPQVIVGPTGGYIIGYFAVTFILSNVCRRTENYPLRLTAALLSLMILYLFGTLWYVAISGVSFWYGLSVCVAPFVGIDIAKAAVALVLADLLSRRITKKK